MSATRRWALESMVDVVVVHGNRNKIETSRGMSRTHSQNEPETTQQDSDSTVVRRVTPEITTVSIPFAQLGFLKTGGRMTIGKCPSRWLSCFANEIYSETRVWLARRRLPSPINPHRPCRTYVHWWNSQVYHRSQSGALYANSLLES